MEGIDLAKAPAEALSRRRFSAGVIGRVAAVLALTAVSACSLLDRQSPPQILSFEPDPETGTSIGRGRRVVIHLFTDDPDNDELDYLVAASGGLFEQSKRDSVIDLFQDSVSVAWIAPAQVGDYTLTIQVNDRKSGEPATSSLTFTITQGRPTARAGADRSEGYADTLKVRLNGEASSDPDRDALRFIWEQIGGPSVSLESREGSNPVFRAFAPADYVFVLRVSDDRAAAEGALTSAPDTVVVRVTDRGGR